MESAFSQHRKNEPQAAKMSADTTVKHENASRVKIKNQPGPSSRFKSNLNTTLNSNKSTGLSKKSMRRLRQKNKKLQQADKTKVDLDDLKKEVDMLKVMKRLNSDHNSIQAKKNTVVNGTVQNVTVSNENHVKPNKIKTSSEKEAKNIQGSNDVSTSANPRDAKIHKLNLGSKSKHPDNLTNGKSKHVINTDGNTSLNKVENKTVPSETNIQKKNPKLPKKRKEPIMEDVTINGPNKKTLKIVNGTQYSNKNSKSNNPANDNEKGSITLGKECFQWIISPWTTETFMAKYWEKKPLYIPREDQNVYKHVFSCKSFDELLRNSDKPIIFGKNIDITSYSVKSGRETHTPDGRAHASVVWDYYNNGCSIRIINPQTFSDPVWKICSTLQDYFGSMVGANVYLTPPGTQGFAPHFDDVDAFLLQLEGKKQWRLYKPKNEDRLARVSSRNFTQEEIGQPCLETTLKAGDMLYMPRGTIHQGYCVEDTHSLHITISCHQRNTFGDLLQKITSSAILSAMENSIDYRKGLPLDLLSFMGSAHSGADSSKRDEFSTRIIELASRMITNGSIDNGVDQMGKKFVHDSLPPYLTPSESKRCVDNGGERWHAGKSKVVNRVEMEPTTQVRLIRANCARLVAESNKSYKLYYNVDNTREYHEIGEEPQFFEVEVETVPCIKALINAYPNYITLEELPLEDLAEKMRIAQDLWEKRLVITREVLEPFKFDDE